MVATRYINALRYGPGLAVGRYLPPPVPVPAAPMVTPAGGGAPTFTAPTNAPAAPYTLAVTPSAPSAPTYAAPVAPVAPTPYTPLPAAPATDYATAGVGVVPNVPQTPDFVDTLISAGGGSLANQAVGFLGRRILNGPGELGSNLLGGSAGDLMVSLPQEVADNVILSAPTEAHPIIDAAASDGGFGSGLLDGFNVGNIANIGAGILGSWGGTTLGSSLVRGDAEQQPFAGSLGGAIGGVAGSAAASALAGAAAGSIIPGIGTLIGAFLGSLAASSLGGGEPDIPWAQSQTYLNPDGTWNPGDVFTGNHASAGRVPQLALDVRNYLAERAASDGLVVNPGMVNTGYALGVYDGGLWFDPGLLRGGPGTSEYAMNTATFGSPAELAQGAYQQLRDRGFFVTPTGGPSWDVVRGDLAQQQAAQQQAAAGGAGTMISGGEGADYWQPLQPTDPGQLFYSGLNPYPQLWAPGQGPGDTYASFPGGVAPETGG